MKKATKIFFLIFAGILSCTTTHSTSLHISGFTLQKKAVVPPDIKESFEVKTWLLTERYGI
jgi:hypothetical protein